MALSAVEALIPALGRNHFSTFSTDGLSKKFIQHLGLLKSVFSRHNGHNLLLDGGKYLLRKHVIFEMDEFLSIPPELHLVEWFPISRACEFSK